MEAIFDQRPDIVNFTLLGAGYFLCSCESSQTLFGDAVMPHGNSLLPSVLALMIQSVTWSSAQCRANHASLLRQDLPEGSTHLPVNCETFSPVSGSKYCSQSCVTPGDLVSNTFRRFLPWPQAVSCVCSDGSAGISGHSADLGDSLRCCSAL